MNNYVIYREKSNKDISRIEKAPADRSLEELKEKVKEFNSNPENSRVVEVGENQLIIDILDYLFDTEKLQNNWRSCFKRDLLEEVRSAQYSLNSLESFVEGFEGPDDDD